MNTTTENLSQNPEGQPDGNEVESPSANSHAGDDEQDERENKQYQGDHVSESQAGAVSAAEGCGDHMIGIIYGETVNVSDGLRNRRRLSFECSYCPHCGVEIDWDALFPPDTRP